MKCTFSDAVSATLRAAKILNSSPDRAREAWELVSPYVTCTELSHVTRRRSEMTIAMILATAGDCHRELGDPRTAAEWYHRAMRFDGFHGYCGYFAKIVVEHGLHEYAASAAESVRRQRAWWSQRGKVYKAISYSIWWIRYGFWRPDMRREFEQQKKYEDRVLALSDALARDLRAPPSAR